MNMFSKINTLLLITFALVYTGCVEDGEDGLNGNDFSEISKYGSVTMIFSGKRPDGIAFRDTVSFPYASTVSGDGSAIYTNYADGTYFAIKRYEATPDNDDKATYVRLYSKNTGGNLFTIDLEFKAVLTTNDFKYFQVYHYQSNAMNYLDKNAPATGFSYDEATGALKYKLSGTIPADGNSTGYDLAIQVDVDVKVYQNVG